MTHTNTYLTNTTEGKAMTYFGMPELDGTFRWPEWRWEVETRILALEAKMGASNQPLPSLAEALETLASIGQDDDDIATVEEDVAPIVTTAENGAITVDLAPATGGVFGTAPVTHDDGDADLDVAAIAATNKAVRKAAGKGKRAPRVRPEVAQVRVKQALRDGGNQTIAEIIQSEAVAGFSPALTVSQVRAALTALETMDHVTVRYKRGKREVWGLTHTGSQSLS